MTDIALFPIPNCVVFPGMVFPLHVFEPRYRQMVNHCLAHQLPIGVCHTRKLLRSAPSDQSPEAVLQTNQSHYRPYQVFSGGPCELVEQLPDGRMRIDVYIRDRYQIDHEIQSLPFRIASCRVYADLPLSDSALAQCGQLQNELLERLRALTSDIPDIQASLAAENWLEKSPEQFSYEVFRFINFRADLQQEILEVRHPRRRLEMVLDILNRAA